MKPMRVGVRAVSAWGLGGRDPAFGATAEGPAAASRLPAEGAVAGEARPPAAAAVAPPTSVPARDVGGGPGGGTTFFLAPDPVRPERFPAGTWRKMSRLARLFVTAAEPLVDLAPEAALIAGVSGGEFASSVAFLESYFVRGAALASPLAFQNSVHNAPAAHLSIGLGLRGASETVLGGERTLWRTLERAMARVVVHGGPVLVVVAEDLTAEVRDGLAVAGATGKWGEGAAAFLLAADSGIPLTWHDGSAPDGAWARSQAWPDERARSPVPAPWDAAFGLGGGAEAVALAALLRAGSGAFAGPQSWLEVG